MYVTIFSVFAVLGLSCAVFGDDGGWLVSSLAPSPDDLVLPDVDDWLVSSLASSSDEGVIPFQCCAFFSKKAFKHHWPLLLFEGLIYFFFPYVSSSPFLLLLCVTVKEKVSKFTEKLKCELCLN